MKIKIQPTEKDGSILLTIEGDATIEDAADIHKQLLSYMDKSNELLLDLSGLKTIDTAALQIFYSACTCAGMEGKKFRVLKISKSAMETAARAGLYQEHFFERIEVIKPDGKHGDVNT